MKVFGIALLLAVCVLGSTAKAGTYGCTEADKTAANHNAADPTKPGTIGGCGTGHYKVHQYKYDQKKLNDQNVLQGPNRLGTGQSF
ncbi:hypothetical protein ACELLULO517_08165 [Acidisoma cellulosilytica]|uniref:Uncharacterized protein n=1 Tax=Acidisoma cellulosilyticum TaxID=2802395 RepID=A0A964E3Q8_9PROT|nr:hypothetical protein [Acidisoma cellulosilyticum]MCB8880203.1 hypothetical protein [Acidisoma cellulosilyticum]